MRAAVSLFSTVLTLLLLASLVILYILPIAGYEAVRVTKEDIKGYSSGDVVYVKKIPAGELEPEDVVAYYDALTAAVQFGRVYMLEPASNLVVARADGSEQIFRMTYASVSGKAALKLPGMAKTVEYMHTDTGYIVASCITIAVFGMRLVLSDKRVKGSFKT